MPPKKSRQRSGQSAAKVAAGSDDAYDFQEDDLLEALGLLDSGAQGVALVDKVKDRESAVPEDVKDDTLEISDESDEAKEGLVKSDESGEDTEPEEASSTKIKKSKKPKNSQKTNKTSKEDSEGSDDKKAKKPKKSQKNKGSAEDDSEGSAEVSEGGSDGAENSRNPTKEDSEEDSEGSDDKKAKKPRKTADEDFAQSLIKKWVSTISTHMKRSRNTILRKEVAPWFEDVITNQSDALKGCYRLKSGKKVKPPVIPSALRATFTDKALAQVSKQDLCAAIVLFYIRGWLYARSTDRKKRDYAMFTGQNKKTSNFLKTMSHWVDDVNLKLTRHIKEPINPPKKRSKENLDGSSNTPQPSQPPQVAGKQLEEASMRDLRKRLRENIFVPPDDITQTEVYYPNSVINDIPNCFDKNKNIFGSKVIAGADADLEKLHASIRGVPKQYAAKHDYETNINYPSELVEELFPLTLDQFESPCAVVMLWNFYQLVKKPPDRRKILLPAGLNRQDAPEDYTSLVRPERAALLLRQAIMFYTSGYCMIQSGLKLQQLEQSNERLIPAGRGTKVIVMSDREKTKKDPKEAKQKAPAVYTSRQFMADQNKDLKALTSEFALQKNSAETEFRLQFRKKDVANFNRLFGLQKKVAMAAEARNQELLKTLVDELYNSLQVAYSLTGNIPNIDRLYAKDVLVESLMNIEPEYILDILQEHETELVMKLEEKLKLLKAESESESQQIINDIFTETRSLMDKSSSFGKLSKESQTHLQTNLDAAIAYYKSVPAIQELNTSLKKLKTELIVQTYLDELLTKRLRQLQAREITKEEKTQEKGQKKAQAIAQKKAQAKQKRSKKSADKENPYKGVVLGPSLIVRGFSRVFNLTNSQTVDNRKNPDEDAVMRAINRCAIFRTPSALKVLDAERVDLAGPALPCNILMDKTSAASALLLAFMELADYMYSPSPPLITRAQLRSVDGYWGDKAFGQGTDYSKWNSDRQRAFRDAYRVQMKKWMNVGFQPTGERDKDHGMPLMNWDTWAPDNVRLVPNPWRVREDNYCRMLLLEFPKGMRNRLGIGKQAKAVWQKESNYGSRVAKIEPICNGDPELYEPGSSLNAKINNPDAELKSIKSKRVDMQRRVGEAMADIAKHFKDNIEPQLGVYYYKTAFQVMPNNKKGTGIKLNDACKMWGKLPQDAQLVTVKPPALLNLSHHPLTGVPVSPSMFDPIDNMPNEWFVYPLNRFDGGLLNGQQFRSDVSVTPRGPNGGMLEDYDITLRRKPEVWDLTVSLKMLAGDKFSCKNNVDDE